MRSSGTGSPRSSSARPSPSSGPTSNAAAGAPVTRRILVARGLLTERQLDQLLLQIGSPVPSFPPFGKYTLLREVGRGAMGVVYEAEDRDLRRRVALKMLAVPAGRDPEEGRPEQDRFHRETQLHKSLPPHPGIVPVLEADVIDGRRYLAMEFVEGVSMGAWCRTGSVTIRQRVALLRDVALAVHHAHRHGILHRDLKPENILVDRTGRPHITDFGLAKLMGQAELPQATATGTALGTPAYMSPEQVRGSKGIDRRSDVYSLGVMLYEILTGRRPFGGDSPYEIMMKTVNEEVIPPSKITSIQINPVLYRNLENICLIALGKRPEDRYPEAGGFARDLTHWLKGDDVRIVVPRGWRVWRAKKWLSRGLVAAALLGLAGTAAWFLRPRAPAPGLPRSGSPAGSTPRGELQPGSIAEYYAGLNFNALGLRKVDTRPAFDDASRRLWPEAGGSWTSRRWRGRLRAPSSGTYVFQVKSQEQARLEIDGVELYSGSRPATVPRELGKGMHRLLLEHSHTGPEDSVSISWKKEGDELMVPIGPASLWYAPEEVQAVAPQASTRGFLGPVPGAEEGETLAVLEHSGHPPCGRTTPSWPRTGRGPGAGRSTSGGGPRSGRGIA